MSKPNRPYVTLAIVSVSYLLLIVDASIAIAALPLIKADLGFSTASLSWVQNAYALSFGGLLLLGSRIGDIYGRKKMFVIGLAFFTLASLLVGFASDASVMILARVLQGVGAAILAPSTLAMLSTSFPVEPGRGRAMAVYSSITGAGTSLGLVLGGWITDALSWRWAFFFNIPIGVALVLASIRFLPETERHQSKIDYWGAITSWAGMSLVVFGLVNAAEQGWSNSVTLGTFIGGILLLVLFVQIEKRVAQPLIPLRLFAHAKRTGGNAGRFLFVGAMGGFWFFVSQFLQNVMGLNALQTGLAFLPMTLASFAVAFMVPGLSRKYGEAPFLAGGLTLVAIGLFWLGQFQQDGSYLTQVALPMLLVGFGQGAATIRLTSAGMTDLAPQDTGAGSGLVSTAVQLGNAFGLSMVIAVAGGVSVAGLGAVAAFVAQAHAALIASAVLALLALLSVSILVLPNRKKK
jgi:EmrB/QacA subfamily drug resistance transporter